MPLHCRVQRLFASLRARRPDCVRGAGIAAPRRLASSRRRRCRLRADRHRAFRRDRSRHRRPRRDRQRQGRRRARGAGRQPALLPADRQGRVHQGADRRAISTPARASAAAEEPFGAEAGTRQQPRPPRPRSRAGLADAAQPRPGQAPCPQPKPCSSRATPARFRRSTPRSPRRPTRRSSAASPQARAAAIFSKADSRTPTRSPPIDVIGERGDQDALALLGAAAARRGTPIVKVAAESAAAAIERRLALLSSVQNAWYGLSLGSVLLLAAIGLAITFGVMGIINMAHGEMVMLGAYTTFVVQEFLRTKYPGLFDWSLPIAIPLAFLVAGAVGIADRARHHPLAVRPPARDAARHLGRQPHPAADRALDLRRQQPRGRRAVLHGGRVRFLRPDDHLWPALDRRVRDGGLRRAALRAARPRPSA